jgi:hypothetical protein
VPEASCCAPRGFLSPYCAHAFLACFPRFELRPDHITPDAQHGLPFDPNIRLRQDLGQKWPIHMHPTHVEDS